MKIPFIIHQIWVGGHSIPDDLLIYKQLWISNHENWEYKLWTDENLPKLKNQKLYDNAKTYSEKSDILRFEILEKYGGIYCDLDFQCFMNIEPIINDMDFFICHDRDWPKHNIKYLNGAFMGCTPHHTLIQRLINELPIFSDKYKNEHVCYRTGPGFVSLILKDEDIGIIDRDMRINNQLVFKHHYRNSWKSVEPAPHDFW